MGLAGKITASYIYLKMNIQLASLVSLDHLLQCFSPLTVEAQLLLIYNISQIINMFVILTLCLNVIFSILKPEMYHNLYVVNGYVEILGILQLIW